MGLLCAPIRYCTACYFLLYCIFQTMYTNDSIPQGYVYLKIPSYQSMNVFYVILNYVWVIISLCKTHKKKSISSLWGATKKPYKCFFSIPLKLKNIYIFTILPLFHRRTQAQTSACSLTRSTALNTDQQS